MNPMHDMPGPAITTPPITEAHGNIFPPLVGPDSTVVDCPFCHANVRTTVKYTTNSGTHLAAALWCRICCLVCLPYCSDDCKNADHYCPECFKYVGTYHRL